MRERLKKNWCRPFVQWAVSHRNLQAPALYGVPDRLVLLPGGKIAFIELKAPGKTLRPLQVRRKRQLEALGFSVYCIDGVEQIGGILSEIQSS